MYKLKAKIKKKENPPIHSPKNNYNSPLGWWKVTTDGDEEGRTTTHLGVFYGHMAEIALSLRSKCFYDLTFCAITAPKPRTRPTYSFEPGAAVHVKLDVESGTWGMDAESRARLAAKFLDCPEVEVLKSNYYAAFVIKHRE